MLMIGVSVP